MVSARIKSELNRIAKLKQIEQLSNQIGSYEKKLRSMVRDLDLKSRDARDKGKKRIDKFVADLEKTRKGLESQLRGFVNREGKNLNQAMNELYAYLRSLAKKERIDAAKKKSKKKAPAKKPARKKKVS